MRGDAALPRHWLYRRSTTSLSTIPSTYVFLLKQIIIGKLPLVNDCVGIFFPLIPPGEIGTREDAKKKQMDC